MKKLLVIVAKCLAGVVGLYVAVCISALIIGAGKGIAWRLSPEGRASLAQQEEVANEFNAHAASLHDHN